MSLSLLVLSLLCKEQRNGCKQMSNGKSTRCSRCNIFYVHMAKCSIFVNLHCCIVFLSIKNDKLIEVIKTVTVEIAIKILQRVVIDETESNKFFEKRKFIILCAVFVCACILVFKKIFVIIRRTFSYENFVFFFKKK